MSMCMTCAPGKILVAGARTTLKVCCCSTVTRNTRYYPAVSLQHQGISPFHVSMVNW